MKKVKIEKSLLELTVGDITKQKTDAIVNAANSRLAPGGGVAGAIHRAAGSNLWEECKTMGGCKTGKAKITKGYKLSAKYVIHTVGPIYSGSSDDPVKLASCYKESINIAKKKNIQSVSFPSLSTGYFGYPIKKAAEIALKTVIEELKKNPNIKLIRFVLFDEKAMEIYEKTLDSLIV
jgi:O-acetyl-ADP-ribose deacetylase (regulator of RNase III)